MMIRMDLHNLRQLLFSEDRSNHLLAYSFLRRSTDLLPKMNIELIIHFTFFPIQSDNDSLLIDWFSNSLSDLYLINPSKQNHTKEHLIHFFNSIDKYRSILINNRYFRSSFKRVFKLLRKFPDPTLRSSASILFDALTAFPLDASISTDFGIYLYLNQLENQAKQIWSTIPIEEIQYESLKKIIQCLADSGNDMDLLSDYIIKSMERYPYNDDVCLIGCQAFYEKKKYSSVIALVNYLSDVLDKNVTLNRYKIYEYAANSAYYDDQDLIQFESFARKSFEASERLSSITETAAQLYQQHGHLNKAIEWQKFRLGNEPMNYFIMKQIAINYLALNNAENALSYFEKMLDINPHLQSIHDTIENLKSS